MSRTPARCTQADIARAIRAVEQAGGDGWAVEVLPDGTIRIGRPPVVLPMRHAMAGAGQVTAPSARKTNCAVRQPHALAT